MPSSSPKCTIGIGSYLFYSPPVREALVHILTHRADVDSTNRTRGGDGTIQLLNAAAGGLSSLSLETFNDVAIRPGTVIRGRFNANDSSSDDEEGGKQVAEDYDSSSSASSALEQINEGSQSSESEDEQPTLDIAQQTIPTDKSKKAGGKRSKAKRKNKRSKDDLLSKMIGNVPSIALPLSLNQQHQISKQQNDTNNDVLQVPTILLPNNYLRDNPNWNVGEVAKYLLGCWDNLNGCTTMLLTDNNGGFESSSTSQQQERLPPTILVVLLQSGRFASAVFSLDSSKTSTPTLLKMLAHKTSTRYTIRKGQGGSQSNHDQSKNKAKSVGAQLRREGEKQLKEDVRGVWREWKRMGYVQRAVGVYVSCPKSMRRDYLFGGDDGSGGLVEKGDGRLRSIPLDTGRPTLEAVSAVVDCVLSCSVREMTVEDVRVSDETEENVVVERSGVEQGGEKGKQQQAEEETKVLKNPTLSYTPLHEAVLKGDLDRLIELLNELEETEEQEVIVEDSNASEQFTPTIYDVNTQGGDDFQTPLHLASASTHPNAPSLINALLIQGRANPSAIDSRGRPPYFLASTDKSRETFRLARGTLGEDYCSWDDEAKVGPPLTLDDVELKKAKALEKKRRQRARQKEKKAADKAAEEEAAAKQRKEEEEAKRLADAKRVRDGLKPKTAAAASNVCDFCQKVVKGRRSQMFQRLEYAYCSTDCVKRHQRELAAEAATRRLGG
ncbi:predicted protein [Thalassiosira pseudonana CCMP1335]|uniref:VLRF1 domain-containing protein n=1 Tax=Thalassiosira pseudonana TaxID=35128 RepID=B8LCE8_THAPS|nr:predicted protein [Thalassiosira pseudonana CCMP1335]EED86974.1 predicted protein [Thalassiosira pseudonana CCMP1335]